MSRHITENQSEKKKKKKKNLMVSVQCTDVYSVMDFWQSNIFFNVIRQLGGI